MQRFKIGDAVLILPKFAHLYPGNTGVIVGIETDRFRQIYNEYTIEFPNGTRAGLFEFQILEDNPNYKTLPATLVFDSGRQPLPAKMRGQISGRQFVLRTSVIDIDMKIQI